MSLPIPKPKYLNRAEVAVKVHRDGREVCISNRSGRAEYRWRTLEMLERQGGRCCLEAYAPGCTGKLIASEATFEHEHGRGGGKRDDRTVLPDGTWVNGAAHALCNGWKGSRYIDFNRSFQGAL